MSTTKNLPRTYLFVPGDRPERFGKALAAGADAVILDLEDAVSPANKATARDAIAAWFRGEGSDPAVRAKVLVRINDDSTAWHGDDVAMLSAIDGLGGVVLPKTERPDQVKAVSLAVRGAPIVALVETARGIRDIDAIAQSHGIQRIAFGTIDYAVDLDLSGDERGFIEPSTRIAIASRAAGIGSAVGGVTADLDGETQLLADLAFARAFGFGAKLCIHPKQVAPIHIALAPTDKELDWAQRVIAAVEAAGNAGAVQVDGKMVDKPVLLRAQALRARAVSR